MTPRKPIPIDLARSLLDYDPATGRFLWKVRVAQRSPAGAEAGYIASTGYRVIPLAGERFGAHRVAWALSFGEQPPNELDHINQIKDDNRIDNLRPADRYQNCANAPARNPASGYKGVKLHTGKTRLPYYAKIRAFGRDIHLGSFQTAEEAGLAYEVAAVRFFGRYAASSPSDPA